MICIGSLLTYNWVTDIVYSPFITQADLPAIANLKEALSAHGTETIGFALPDGLQFVSVINDAYRPSPLALAQSASITMDRVLTETQTNDLLIHAPRPIAADEVKSAAAAGKENSE